MISRRKRWGGEWLDYSQFVGVAGVRLYWRKGLVVLGVLGFSNLQNSHSYNLKFEILNLNKI